ncbi:phage tail tube protein [Streptomyces cylindrosporus]|uniref:Phage tail protein n=1 Tax=Streptomyces cylindrosporus TaxID=2927583 RepID=A0ABS9Y2G1_9ACTN|nr:hypothetical protein [Streptomyces cylindrosporus]MCI3271392.1 hypothetical protein [Streptomyces cylindrosporus]
MALQKYNARDVDFQIEDFLSPGTWITIGGLNTFTKGHSEETTDTTTYASAGQEESQKMQIGKTLGLQGLRLRDDTTGAGDSGQAKVEALAERLGENSLGRVRFSHKNDTTWLVWTAHVALGDQGGGNNDKVSWECTFTRSGAESTVAKP